MTSASVSQVLLREMALEKLVMLVKPESQPQSRGLQRAQSALQGVHVDVGMGILALTARTVPSRTGLQAVSLAHPVQVEHIKISESRATACHASPDLHARPQA